MVLQPRFSLGFGTGPVLLPGWLDGSAVRAGPALVGVLAEAEEVCAV